MSKGMIFSIAMGLIIGVLFILTVILYQDNKQYNLEMAHQADTIEILRNEITEHECPKQDKTEAEKISAKEVPQWVKDELLKFNNNTLEFYINSDGFMIMSRKDYRNLFDKLYGDDDDPDGFHTVLDIMYFGFQSRHTDTTEELEIDMLGTKRTLTDTDLEDEHGIWDDN